MAIFSENTLLAAERGELQTLAELDARGFLCGEDEDCTAYAQRLRCLQKNIAAMNEALAKDGFYDIEGMRLHREERIAEQFFQEVKSSCERLYAFSIDWVPGFFIDPSFSFLFGGCAFYFYPDFFAVFIIRRSFKQRARWLIYQRQELLAHELCHVARLALASTVYEENFAYQGSHSALRRLLGGIFHRQQDSFLFLGVTFLLLLAQIVRTQFLPVLPIWPFWSLLAAVFAWLLARHAYFCGRFRRALKSCARFGGDQAMPILFRCSDQEIQQLAQIKDDASARSWFDERCANSLRWKIIQRRFGKKK
jgi:hypothetical protein